MGLIKRLKHYVRDIRFLFLLFSAVLGPLSITILSVRFSLIRNLELIAYDWHLKSSPQRKPDPRLVLVGMDDGSLGKLGYPSYPLPRSVHGKLVSELEKAGARVIGFDVMFTNAAPELAQEDKKFFAALKSHGNVFSALQPVFSIIDGTEELSFVEPDFRLRSKLQSGSINVPRTFGSSVRTFIPTYVDYKTGKRFLQLSTLLIAANEGADDTVPSVRDHFRLGSMDAPLGPDGEVFIRYVGPPGSFNPVPYYTVLNGSWRKSLHSSFFRGKIVLVGRISPLEDRQITPVGEMQGCEILMNATQTLLRNDYIHRTGAATNLILRHLLCLALAIYVWKRGLFSGLRLSLIVGVLWSAFAHYLFLFEAYWFDTVTVLLSIIMAMLLVTAVESHFVATAFQRFMPTWVAQGIIQQSGNVSGLKSELTEITVIFCDIRGFTSLSETLDHSELQKLLSNYYSIAERLANRYGTQLDKFVGDEIMLYFDSCDRSNNRNRKADVHHAVRGVQWALDMTSELKRLARSGETSFEVGIGICTGKAQVGIFGGEQRKQHTVYGDTVNVASRLQHATRDVGSTILISESAFDAVKHVIPCEPLGSISVKGKQAPINIFAPVMEKSVEH